MFCYSSNREFFHGDCETREEAIEEGFDYEPDEDIIYTGVADEIKFSDLISAESILDETNDRLYDIIGDTDYDVYPKVTVEQIKELDIYLKDAIDKWAEDEGLVFSGFRVVDIQEHNRNDE